jgi:hypothetical protein
MIVISRMADTCLTELETTNGDDVDAENMDQLVERVQSSLNEQFDEALTKARQETAAQAARAEVAEDSASKREMSIVRRAGRWGRNVASVLYFVLISVVLLGAVSIALEQSFTNWIRITVALAICTVLVVEMFGVLRHLSEFRRFVEAYAAGRFELLLRGDTD